MALCPILGKTCGVFGYSEASLKEIGMYHMMKESAVEKAKSRAVEKLRESYPGSRLQVWRTVHRMMRRPVPPPGETATMCLGWGRGRPRALLCAAIPRASAPPEEKPQVLTFPPPYISIIIR